MKIRLIKGIEVKVVPTFDIYKVHSNYYAPITKVDIDNYISLYTVRVPNRRGDRLVYLKDYNGIYVFYVPYKEDIWSEFAITYELTSIENDILGFNDNYGEVVANNISDMFATYGYFVDSDLIKRFCCRVITSPDYSIDEIKDMLLLKELNK